jgi:hypothetical protein
MANQNQPQQPQQGHGQQGGHPHQGFGNSQHQKVHAEAKKVGITVPDWLQNLINEYGDQAATFIGTMIIRILTSLKKNNLKQSMQAQGGQGCPQHLKAHLEATHEAALAAAIESACACCAAGCDCPDCDDDPCDRG